MSWLFWLELYLLLGALSCVVGEQTNRRRGWKHFTWDEVAFIMLLWWAIWAVAFWEEFKKGRKHG